VATARRERDELDGAGLKTLVQGLVRGLGLLETKRTPCGFPISVSQAHGLMLLLERERQGVRTSQTELGQSLHVDKSNVARLCSKLEEAGQARQREDPEDGRARLVELTAKGQRLAEKLKVASDERSERLLGAVPAKARAQLFASLSALTEAVRAIEREEEPG
jgi:DNA-binding MarR family transcriptional regulator